MGNTIFLFIISLKIAVESEGQTMPTMIMKSNLFLLLSYVTLGSSKSNLPWGSEDISIFFIYKRYGNKNYIKLLY
jgi:hypothetical protein